MLKGIPKLLSPELLKVLCEMGHSDRIVIGDGNFPAEIMGKNAKVIRYDGQDIPALLDAILTVFPLDTYVDTPVSLMELMDRDKGRVQTPIWDEYKAIVARHDDRGADAVGTIERFAFYEEAKKCYAVIATGESAIYANVILQKGVVTD
jgi:L-fucose mutarotase